MTARTVPNMAIPKRKIPIGFFAPYAYSGAIISSLTCVGLGYFLGSQASWVLASIARLGLLTIVVAAIFFSRRAIRKGNPEAVNTTAAATATSAIPE